MNNIIYTFFLGVAFSMGAMTGLVLCALADRKARLEMKKEITDHGNRVEDRLAKYVIHTERIAVALEAAAKK